MCLLHILSRFLGLNCSARSMKLQNTEIPNTIETTKWFKFRKCCRLGILCSVSFKRERFSSSSKCEPMSEMLRLTILCMCSLWSLDTIAITECLRKVVLLHLQVGIRLLRQGDNNPAKDIRGFCYPAAADWDSHRMRLRVGITPYILRKGVVFLNVTQYLGKESVVWA